jgi:hypothetical protein
MCPEAGSREVPCEFCARYAAESPEYLVDVNGTLRCDPYCTGFQTEYNGPQVNLSGYNTAQVLRMLDIPAEEYGSIPAAEVPEVLRRVIRALNVTRVREHTIEEAFEERGALGCRAVGFGNTDEDTVRRLTSLQTLLVYAADHGFEVVWS